MSTNEEEELESAQASAEAPETSTSSDMPEGSDDVSFLLYDDEDEHETQEEVFQEPGVGDDSPPDSPPQETESTVENEPETQETEPVAQSQTAPPASDPGQQSPAPAALDPEEYSRWYTGTVQALASQVYTLDEETREVLDSEPSKVLPQLMANMHMQILSGGVAQMTNLMPTLMQQYAQAEKANTAAEQEFFTEYPELKGREQEVVQVAQMYRRTYPQAPADKAAKDIAALSMLQLKIAPRQYQEPAVAQAPARPPVPQSARSSAPPRVNPSLNAQQRIIQTLIEDDD